MKRFTDEVHSAGLILEVSEASRDDDFGDDAKMVEFSLWNQAHEIDYLVLKKNQVSELIKHLQELIR